MTDLITYAVSSMNPETVTTINYDCDEEKRAAYLAAWESTQTGHMPSSSRCNVWRRFIKEHGGIDDVKFVHELGFIPAERQLVGRDEYRSTIHPYARTFPSLTVSNVLKYMP